MLAATVKTVVNPASRRGIKRCDGLARLTHEAVSGLPRIIPESGEGAIRAQASFLAGKSVNRTRRIEIRDLPIGRPDKAVLDAT
jgi:hypothetical protein